MLPHCLVPRLPLVAHRALLDYGIPPIPVDSSKVDVNHWDLLLLNCQWPLWEYHIATQIHNPEMGGNVLLFFRHTCLAATQRPFDNKKSIFIHRILNYIERCRYPLNRPTIDWRSLLRWNVTEQYPSVSFIHQISGRHIKGHAMRCGNSLHHPANWQVTEAVVRPESNPQWHLCTTQQYQYHARNS